MSVRICLDAGQGTHTPVFVSESTFCSESARMTTLFAPSDCTKIDWEVELAMAVGRHAKRMTPEMRLDCHKPVS